MFQYAFARGISARLNTSMKMDCSLLLDRARGTDVVYRVTMIWTFLMSNKIFQSTLRSYETYFELDQLDWVNGAVHWLPVAKIIKKKSTFTSTLT